LGQQRRAASEPALDRAGPGRSGRGIIVLFGTAADEVRMLVVGVQQDQASAHTLGLPTRVRSGCAQPDETAPTGTSDAPGTSEHAGRTMVRCFGPRTLLTLVRASGRAPSSGGRPDGSGGGGGPLRDLGADAFYPPDPPPMACDFDGGMLPPPPPPGGTLECPD